MTSDTRLQHNRPTVRLVVEDSTFPSLGDIYGRLLPQHVLEMPRLRTVGEARDLTRCHVFITSLPE
ncbi:MAG TPA: hypothetical protein VN650_09005 [Gemmatimonadaceae bacterium]|nr:hypothetical protein [Gemmatimonadaceae bacterium]